MISAGWWAESNPKRLVYESKDYFADLPVLDGKPSRPATMMIMDSTASAWFLKGTTEKVLN